MPELVAGGPIIPVRLLNELDGGRVVFFCGAGISEGAGSGLPGFVDLVEHVYEANGMEPDAVEREARDLDEPDRSRRRPNFDKALGLLERPERLGPQALRRTVIERLSQPPTGELAVHRALLVLSRNERGVRLITTNFDNRFVEAGLEEELVDAAPKLPVPKPHTWASLVHLHGRIGPNEGGANLVLTAADFGRAYLTEQWAARFVTELFREFTVVFVGYSVGDPVMGYMVDALAAERALGAKFATAYAFADEDGTRAGRTKARDGWRAKNVEPILYDQREGHRLLAETLIEWARIRNDPFFARSRIAIHEITRMPAGPDDAVVERVIWALQDPVAAKALADEPPILDEDEFAKLERWLEMFEQQGLLCCTPTEATPGTSGQDASVVRLVHNGFQSRNPHALDMTRAHIARWMARHLHVPQLLAWVLRSGGRLHPGLRQEVERVLAEKDSNIPPRLRLLWTILLENRTEDPWRHLWTSDRYLAASSDAERRRIEENVIESMTPRLVVRPGPDSRLAFRQYFEDDPGPIPPIDACGHLKLELGDDDTRGRTEAILGDTGTLAGHAETLTGYLERAIALGVEDDEVYGESYLYRPSIAAHGQNRDHDGWTRLIDLVRDSYFALARAKRPCAANLLRRWVASGDALFRRLALHALAEDPKSNIRLAGRLLLAGRKPGVWELDLRREVLRFLRLAGRRLPRDLRTQAVRTIHAGPTYNKRKAPPGYGELIRREKALRLHKLQISGARLDRKSRALADEVEPDPEGDPDDRDEFLSWHGEARWIGDEEFAPKGLLEGSVADLAAVLGADGMGRDEFRGLVVQRPVKVAFALRRLANEGRWPAHCWQGFLWFLVEPREPQWNEARLRGYVARVLAGAPGELIEGIGSAAGGFVKRLAEEWGADREPELVVLWQKAWESKGVRSQAILGVDDPLTDALNHSAGKLAEVALARLGKYELRAGAGLPVQVRPYFDAIGADPEGELGRVMLATRLHYLHSIDPDWAGEHLLPRLVPGGSAEARALWYAYGWSPTVGPDLLQGFKGSFLAVLRGGEDAGHPRRNLTHLFMVVCMSAPGELTTQEIRSVVDTFSEGPLKTVLGALTSRLKGDGPERAAIWENTVSPWLRDYWPRAAVRNTSGTTEAMLGMLVECGDAFPDAAGWSLDYLRPLDGHGLYRLGENGHAERHPDWVLQVLEKVVAADVLPVHERYTLHGILDELLAADADKAGDAKFQRLYQIATR